MTVLFQDDFASGTLLTTDNPAGKWNSLTKDASSTCAADTSNPYTVPYAAKFQHGDENFAPPANQTVKSSDAKGLLWDVRGK